MIVYTYRKEKITIADEVLASGGEGEVRKVIACPSRFRDVCAKLYFKPKQTKELEEKIRFMVENPPDQITGNGMMLAWPMETIYSQKGGGFLGFIMPTAFPDSKKLVILTTPKIKKVHKDEWYKYDKERDIRVALTSRLKLINNIAIPVHLLHATGKYVLKDFKPDNVLVTPTGKVTIVDMDSIQICNNGNLLFPGTAATENYVPPEFFNNGVGRNQKMPLSISWDNFAVGVVFYQLLFGLSPYAVTPVSKDEDSCTIPYCISHNLFPYGSNSSKISKIPQPHKNFKVIPRPIQQLFIRTFGNNPDERPQAKEWVRVIKTILRSMQNSGNNKPSPSPSPSPAPSPSPSPSPSSPPAPPPPPSPSPKSDSVTRKFCPSCGTLNSPTARFCKSCGHDFEKKDPPRWLYLCLIVGSLLLIFSLIIIFI